MAAPSGISFPNALSNWEEGTTYQIRWTKTSTAYPFAAIHLLKNDALQRIDRAASEVCVKYISQGVGQDARYIIKHIQAINYLEDIDNKKLIRELSILTYVGHRLALQLIHNKGSKLNVTGRRDICNALDRCASEFFRTGGAGNNW